MSSILRILRETTFPVDPRGGVRKSTTDVSKGGFMLGRTLNYGIGIFTVSRKTRDPKYFKLCQALNAWVTKRYPDFKYSSIQVNAGSSALHVDRLNCGASLIKAYGKFTGGGLWVMDTPNVVHNIKTNGKFMDGNIPHITMPHKGERFSVVFFHMKGAWKELNEEESGFLKSQGFNLPQKGELTCGKPNRHKLPEAALILKKNFGLTSKYIGDLTMLSKYAQNQKKGKETKLIEKTKTNSASNKTYKQLSKRVSRIGVK
jgi:hypothetical protein